MALLIWVMEQHFTKEQLSFSSPDFELVHVDEFVDELLHNDRVCDVILPRIQV